MFDKFVNELQTVFTTKNSARCNELVCMAQHVQVTRLFALLRLYLPHVEFQLLAFKNVAVTASTLSWS